MHRLYLALTSTLVLFALPLPAQARTDTTGFRRGQWGVEFIPGTSFTTVGVLRFNTPTRAWVLDGSSALNRQTGSGTAVPEQTSSVVGVFARLGPRWYHAEYERVVRFVGLGLSGSYSGSSSSAGTAYNAESWSAGIYGELGFQYLFTPHLGLGVREEVQASRYATHSTQNGTTSRTTTNSLVLGSPQVLGAFYF